MVFLAVLWESNSAGSKRCSSYAGSKSCVLPSTAPPTNGNAGQITYLMRKTTYSNREFDIIGPLNGYLLFIFERPFYTLNNQYYINNMSCYMLSIQYYRFAQLFSNPIYRFARHIIIFVYIYIHCLYWPLELVGGAVLRSTLIN